MSLVSRVLTLGDRTAPQRRAVLVQTGPVLEPIPRVLSVRVAVTSFSDAGLHVVGRGVKLRASRTRPTTATVHDLGAVSGVTGPVLGIAVSGIGLVAALMPRRSRARSGSCRSRRDAGDAVHSMHANENPASEVGTGIRSVMGSLPPSPSVKLSGPAGGRLASTSPNAWNVKSAV